MNKFIFSIFIIIILFFNYISIYVEKYYRQIKFGIDNNYSYILLSNDIYEYNTYLYYGNDTYFISDNKKIDAFILMETETKYNTEAFVYTNNIVKGKYDTLKYREAAISRNLANKLKLNINDSIYFNNNSINKKEEYKIKYIFYDSYGLYDVDIDNNYGVIIIGFNYEYASNIRADKIIPISLENFNKNINNINFNEIYKKNTNYFNFAIYIKILILFVILLSVLTYIYIFNNYRKTKYEFMIMYGCKKYLIKFYILKDFILLAFLPACFIILVAILFNIILNAYISLFTIILLSSILLVPIFIVSIYELIILNNK